MKAYRSTLILITNISVVFLFWAGRSCGEKALSGSEISSYDDYIIKTIEITGVKSFPVSDIRKLLLTKPNRWYNIFNKRELSRANVAVDANIIRRFYERRGYLFTAVEDSIMFYDNGRASVVFKVSEEVRSILSGIASEGGIPQINRKFDKALSRFKIREPLNGIAVRSAGFVLRDIYNNNGYPYANITNHYIFNVDSTSVIIVFAAAESVYTLNGDVTIGTEGKTRTNVITRELVNKPGEEYSKKDIIESEQRLYSSGLFRMILPP